VLARFGPLGECDWPWPDLSVGRSNGRMVGVNQRWRRLLVGVLRPAFIVTRFSALLRYEILGLLFGFEPRGDPRHVDVAAANLDVVCPVIRSADRVLGFRHLNQPKSHS
jgi:hypothetical protein